VFLVCSKRTCSDSSGITFPALSDTDVPLKSANNMTAFHDLLSNDGFIIEMWVDMDEYTDDGSHTICSDSDSKPIQRLVGGLVLIVNMGLTCTWK